MQESSGLGRYPGIGSSLHYSCLENPVDRGAWQATVHEVKKSQTQLKWQHSVAHILCKSINFQNLWTFQFSKCGSECVISITTYFLLILLFWLHLLLCLFNHLFSTYFLLFFFFFFGIGHIMCACIFAKSLQSCPNFCDPVDFSLTVSSVQWDSPGKNTGVDCCALPLGIFPTQRSNLCLTFPALAGRFFSTSAPWEAHYVYVTKFTNLERYIFCP